MNKVECVVQNESWIVVQSGVGMLKLTKCKAREKR